MTRDSRLVVAARGVTLRVEGIDHPDRIGAGSDAEDTERRGVRMGEEGAEEEGRSVPFWDWSVGRAVTPPPGVFL